VLENPSDEIMIWVNSAGGAGPIGGVIATVNLEGGTWDLHRGNIGWEVWSFVRTSNSGSGSLNIKSFTDYLRNTWGLSASKYLTSVQFGSEIFHGVGNVNVTNYTTTVGGGTSTGIIANGTYRIIARHSAKAVDVVGGHWCVVQQGVNDGRRQTRRYDWLRQSMASIRERSSISLTFAQNAIARSVSSCCAPAQPR
jgi:hypothetical protein